NISVKDIKNITIKTYHLAIKQCGFTNPTNSYIAKFSFAFVVGLTLILKRPLKSSDFSDIMLNNEELLALQNKVTLEWSEDIEKRFPKEWQCEVIIELNNGRYVQKRINNAKGDPLNPMTDDELEKKVYDCATGILPKNQINQLITTINNIESLSNIKKLYNLLIP